MIANIFMIAIIVSAGLGFIAGSMEADKQCKKKCSLIEVGVNEKK